MKFPLTRDYDLNRMLGYVSINEKIINCDELVKKFHLGLIGIEPNFIMDGNIRLLGFSIVVPDSVKGKEALR